MASSSTSKAARRQHGAKRTLKRVGVNPACHSNAKGHEACLLLPPCRERTALRAASLCANKKAALLAMAPKKPATGVKKPAKSVMPQDRRARRKYTDKTGKQHFYKKAKESYKIYIYKVLKQARTCQLTPALL